MLEREKSTSAKLSPEQIVEEEKIVCNVLTVNSVVLCKINLMIFLLGYLEVDLQHLESFSILRKL